MGLVCCGKSECVDQVCRIWVVSQKLVLPRWKMGNGGTWGVVAKERMNVGIEKGGWR